MIKKIIPAVAAALILIFAGVSVVFGHIDNTDNIDFIGDLPMPCDSKAYISSDYGQRIHPVKGTSKKHTGIDFVPEWHSNIYAVDSGYVERTDYDEDFGNSVTIRHLDKNGEIAYYSFYAHLSVVYVEDGDKINTGDIIACEGGDPDFDEFPGSSTGHHLHFEIRLEPKYGSDVNPKLFLSGN